MTRQIGSLLNGAPAPGNPGSRRTIANPARLDEIVAEVTLADEATFVQACRLAKQAQPAWAAVPAPVRGRAIQQLGRLVEDNAEALARIITRESASRSGNRAARSRRSSTPARSSSARDDGCTA